MSALRLSDSTTVSDPNKLHVPSSASSRTSRWMVTSLAQPTRMSMVWHVVTGNTKCSGKSRDQSHTNVLSRGQRHGYEAGQHPALQSSARTKPQGSAGDRARSCVRLTRLVKWRESQSQVQPLLQKHVIVSLVRDCYPHAVAWS